MGKIIRNGVTYGSTSNIAGNISYDNSSSDLISVTVQNAITELSRLIIDDGDVQQVDTMPAASEDKEGKVIQYIGDTNQYFTHNYFYECVSDGGDPATYTWQEVQVCAGVGRTEKDNSGNALGEYFNKYEDTESGGVTTHRNMATGEHSHAEGHGENTAGGVGSHVEGGYNTITAAGSFAHAENSNNTANAHSSHVEGAYNTANGTYSHVEGVYNTTAASSLQSHVEGNSNNAASATTHLEGTQNVGGSFINQSLAKTVIVSSLPSAASANTTTLYLLWDNNTHQYEAYKKVNSELVSQGYLTVIPGQSVHAEGQNNISAGGHIEGSNNVSRQGEVTNHVEGNNNYVDTNNINVHIEGAAHTVPAWSNTSNYDDKGGHIEGYKHQFAMTQQSSTVAPASYHIEGSENTVKDINWLNHNINTTDYGTSCHIEGHQNVSGGFATHTEGQLNSAFGDSAHAEGKYNKVDGLGSHVEGNHNIAYGHETHVEGFNNEVIVNPNGNDYDSKHFHCVHVEGWNNIAGATGLHIEGYNNIFYASSFASTDQFAHIEGKSNSPYSGVTDISGSHVEGEDNVIGGKWSHVEGQGNIANGNHIHVSGKYNHYNEGDLFEVGNGAGSADRSNIIEASSTYFNVNGDYYQNGQPFTPVMAINSISAADLAAMWSA